MEHFKLAIGLITIVLIVGWIIYLVRRSPRSDKPRYGVNDSKSFNSLRRSMPTRDFKPVQRSAPPPADGGGANLAIGIAVGVALASSGSHRSSEADSGGYSMDSGGSSDGGTGGGSDGGGL